MNCPVCNHDLSGVLKTTVENETGAIVRVRECSRCQHVWRTREDFFPAWLCTGVQPINAAVHAEPPLS